MKRALAVVLVAMGCGTHVSTPAPHPAAPRSPPRMAARLAAQAGGTVAPGQARELLPYPEGQIDVPGCFTTFAGTRLVCVGATGTLQADAGIQSNNFVFNNDTYYDDGGGYCFRDHTCQTTAAADSPWVDAGAGLIGVNEFGHPRDVIATGTGAITIGTQGLGNAGIVLSPTGGTPGSGPSIEGASTGDALYFLSRIPNNSGYGAFNFDTTTNLTTNTPLIEVRNATIPEFWVTQGAVAIADGGFFTKAWAYVDGGEPVATQSQMPGNYVTDGGGLVASPDVQFLPGIHGVYTDAEFDVFFNTDYSHKAFSVAANGSGQITGVDSIGQLRYRFGGTSDAFIRDSLYVGTTMHADGGVDVGADGSISNLKTETAVGTATGLQVNTSVADSASNIAYQITNSTTLSLSNNFLWRVRDASGTRASLSGAGVLLATGGFDARTNKVTEVDDGTLQTDAANVRELRETQNVSGYMPGAWTVDTGFGRMVASPSISSPLQEVCVVNAGGGIKASGASNITATLYDVTGAYAVCSVIVAACSSAVGTIGSSACAQCDGGVAIGDTVDVRWTGTTTCDTNPSLNVNASF